MEQAGLLHASIPYYIRNLKLVPSKSSLFTCLLWQKENLGKQGKSVYIEDITRKMPKLLG